MTVAFGWRSIFSINLPLGVVAFALVPRRCTSRGGRPPIRSTSAGRLLLAFGVTALLFATFCTGRGAAGILGLVGRAPRRRRLLSLFVRRQRRLEHPLIPPVLFAAPRSATPYVAGLLLGHDDLRRGHLRAAVRPGRARRHGAARRARW